MLENPVFMIQNWPTYHEAAAATHVDIKETHHIVPVLAYGLARKLIKPQNYHCQLEGALVELYFGLSHLSIARKRGEPGGNDVYTADIVIIHVLAMPNTIVAGMPRKQKHHQICQTPLTPDKAVAESSL